MPDRQVLVDQRVIYLTGAAGLLALVCVFVAQGLTHLIGLVTNLAFHGTLSTALTSPADHALGAWVIVVPAIGGLVVGLMARFGAEAIRGHGIPEAMAQILTNDSRIPVRMTFLKPLSAAIAIGTGGPFGAEGPIIATGGAMGSVLGQVLSVTAVERKTLLAAGAAAGMAAIFNSPMAAVLLAIELLLFEFKPRSLIPVALAVVVATAARQAMQGSGAVFAMAPLPAQPAWHMLVYMGIGGLIGLASVGVTKAVYAIEDAFAHLPIHWMWWPALGGLAVGAIGCAFPLTLGVGYTNIEGLIGGHWGVLAMLSLLIAKFISWVIALGSGTSGGTLAPLFTIGGAMGGLIAWGLTQALPGLHIDPGMAALVGMAAMFAGASRAVLTSVLFAFETTGQSSALLPLLSACALAYLVSCLTMHTTIMTEKIVRRGVRVPDEYGADTLAQTSVGQACTRPAFTLETRHQVGALRRWMNSHAPHADHQGYPVIDEQGALQGVVTRRDVFEPGLDEGTTLSGLLKRAPMVVTPSHSLREAADHMVLADIGRLVVVDPLRPTEVLGILTRADLLASQARHVREARDAARHWPRSVKG